MKEYGVMGYPLRHTLSPAMHEAAFRARGLEARYQAYPVEDLREGMRLIREIPLAGVSVTMPFKVEVMGRLDGLDETASRIGSVNTVVRRAGRLIGHNTDWTGALRTLHEATSLEGRDVLLLGAGGSARAVAYGVAGQGAGLTVTSRDRDRGEALCRAFGGSYLPWDRRGESRHDVVVNATPLGAHGLEEDLPLPAEALREGMVVMDLVYQPLSTRFLRAARERGCRIIDGLRMLLYQGGEQFFLWTGMAPPWEAMEEAIYGGSEMGQGV